MTHAVFVAGVKCVGKQPTLRATYIKNNDTLTMDLNLKMPPYNVVIICKLLEEFAIRNYR